MLRNAPYELFDELGRGDHTVVFRAYDLTLGREVAIKRLEEPYRSNDSRRQQFLQEARFLAQFEHDNILRVYSVDEQSGWIVMERMVDTLATLVAAGPSDPDLVRGILRQALGALDFLHQRDKVHGSVRPSNLLINEYGRVKLSEFEQLDPGGELRAPAGSKKYLAPELIRPEFGPFHGSADLYCLGFTALELLLGAKFDSLFPGTGAGAIDADLAWMRWHSSPDQLPPLQQLVKHVPDDLALVIDAMLRKPVADRPRSAQQVLRDLTECPLLPVPVRGGEGPPAVGDVAAPSVKTLVREVAPLPKSTLATAPMAAETAKPRRRKPGIDHRSSAASRTASSNKRFSRVWLNEQLGKSYVLYPLCAVMLLGALGLGLAPSPQGRAPGKRPKDLAGNGVVIPSVPDPADVHVTQAGVKDMATQSPEPSHLQVAIQVEPADATVMVEDRRQSVEDGRATYDHVRGTPLELAVRRSGYRSMVRVISADELAAANYTLHIRLEKSAPSLPADFVAVPSTEYDPHLGLPTRIRTRKLDGRAAMELALIRPGNYRIGVFSEDRYSWELAGTEFTLPGPLYVATRETTNRQYANFYQEVGEDVAGRGWLVTATKYSKAQRLPGVENDLPVTNVSFAAAERFCAWVGGRLPNEAEWESAARGSDDRGFPYPWRGPLDSERCRIFRGGAPMPVLVTDLTEGQSRDGLTHLLGNAAEWCSDRATDATNANHPTARFVIKGCSFATARREHIRTSWRGSGSADGEWDIGFRVCVSLPSSAAEAETQPRVAPRTSHTGMVAVVGNAR